MGGDDWLERYQRGEQEQVWHELRLLGDRVRDTEHFAAAQAVCDEMARRARRNVETLVERLAEQGYRFHSNDNDKQPLAPFIPATAKAADLADWLEKHVGPLPMTVASWLRLVGDVWLAGTHPQWPESLEADPFVIQLEGSHYPQSSIKDSIESECDDWRQWGPAAGCPFVLSVAPDRLTKANISGGPPYGFRLPDPCADGLFKTEIDTPFVAYLNRVFRAGGFPGRAGGENRWEIIRSLREGMLPL
ncbi:MAG: hypothetical protein LBI84_07555 [Propionibacteriaceae bacterium]|jgi:hypothetical protein|nr:hypothetical protein [Propionibacteriaceae bacterium]